MSISRRGFLKLLVAAPIASKVALADGLIKTATEKKIITGPEPVLSSSHNWHLAVIDTKTYKVLFNDHIDGNPDLQAARVTRSLQSMDDRMLTVYLTPCLGDQAIKGQKSYYSF